MRSGLTDVNKRDYSVEISKSSTSIDWSAVVKTWNGKQKNSESTFFQFFNNTHNKLRFTDEILEYFNDIPGDLKTRLSTGTSCQIEIHFSI